jgi:hypothetical protein
MANLGLESERVFHCATCGTVKSVDANGFENVTVPALVGRVRDCLKQSIAEPRSFSVAAWYFRAACEAAGLEVDAVKQDSP